MGDRQKNYIPALGYRWLTNLYDPIMRWTMHEEAFKSQLVRQLNATEEHRILDLGCGTATLTLFLKQTYPHCELVGLDGDPDVLFIAKKKAEMAGALIEFHQGFSYDLPYPDESFNRVVSSLLFHHLTYEDKLRTLREAYRVLKPGGELHLADWGKPRNKWSRFAFLSVQMIDGFETTKDNVEGKLPELMNDSGFSETRETNQFTTVYGTLSLYRAIKTK